MLEQSYFAYLALCSDFYPQYRDARSINGEIISDVESYDGILIIHVPATNPSIF